MIVKIDKSLQKDLKKLKGAKNFYRVRMGSYRLGMIIKGEEVTLIRLLHRKDIYKFFP